MTLRLTYAPWGETLAEMVDAARAAEAAGAEVVWAPELHRSATVTAAALAAGTTTVGVGTAIALAFTRSPMVTALEAMDLDEMAQGRFVLGLGTGVQRLNEDWHNAQWGKPVAHLRETVAIVREVIARCTDGEPIVVEGEYEHARIKGYQRPYHRQRAEIPLYLAGMGPVMTAVAAEIGDGWISHELCSPAFVREQVLPSIATGSSAPARSAPTSTSSSRRAARSTPTVQRRVARAAGIVGFYASVRTYADFFAFHGFADDQARVIDAFKSGEVTAQKLGDVVSDAMVDTLTIAGTPDDVRDSPRGVRRRRRLGEAQPAHARPRRRRDPRVAEGRHRTHRRPVGEGRPMKPLQDVRIIAVEQYGAGPWGTVQLADLGAEIIKIEDPSVARRRRPLRPAVRRGRGLAVLRGRSTATSAALSLDLAPPEGRAVFEDLVRNADAVYSNLRGDVPTKIGITYDDLKHLNPAIVCCSLSGFGMTGPRVKEPGYDYILQGLAGWMDVTGDPDGPPTKSGLSLVDYSGGLVAAISLLAGIHAARRDGVGMDCDVSLYDTAFTLLTYPATWHLNDGFTPARTRHSAHPSLVPFQAFQTKDSLDRGRVREGEVLAAARADARARGVARRRALRDVRRARHATAT